MPHFGLNGTKKLPKSRHGHPGRWRQNDAMGTNDLIKPGLKALQNLSEILSLLRSVILPATLIQDTLYIMPAGKKTVNLLQ